MTRGKWRLLWAISRKCCPHLLHLRPGHREVETGGDLAADADGACQVIGVADFVRDRHVNVDRLARTNHPSELRFVDPRDDRNQTVGLVILSQNGDEYRGGLKRHFALNDPRKHREIGIVPLEDVEIGIDERLPMDREFIVRDDLVEPKKGWAMRDQPHDLVTLHGGGRRGGSVGPWR